MKPTLTLISSLLLSPLAALHAADSFPVQRKDDQGASTSLKASASHNSPSNSFDALGNDQIPTASNDMTMPRFTWWDHKGGTEWVQYDFSQPKEVSSVQVYWFDDIGTGQCRIPESWRLLYQDGGTWKPVSDNATTIATRDQFNPMSFAPIKTRALRIEVELQSGFSGGLLKWHVNAPAVFDAGKGATDVPLERMLQVYDEVKTPFKYGVVIRGETDQMVDSPSVFRQNNQWYMIYVGTKGAGYETFLARSADLLHWEKLGKIMSFRPDGWDRWQRAGYAALIDTTWGGSNELQTFDGKYWLSYLGGASQGYESDPLAIGLAWTKTPSEASEWTPLAENPVLHRDQPDVRPFEKETLYKSNIIWDKAKTLGAPFVMFYNGKIKTGYEKIGMAVSDDMVHWKRHGADSVVANGEDKQSGITGDPQVVKMGDLWVMFYFGAFWRPGAFDTFACSTDLVHWTKWTGPDLIQSSEPWDQQYAHKPWVVKHGGVVYHFYNAVGDQGRVIALATSKDLRDESKGGNKP
jgi:predicted GH43/DUF377 family glycosyl hydrolase